MTNIKERLATYPFVVDQMKMTEHMAAFGWRAAAEHEIPLMLDLGERLIGDRLVAPEILAHLHALTGITAWVFGDPIEGLVISVPLSEMGLRAIEANQFIAQSPDDKHIAAAGELCAGVYIGIYAGETKEARKAVMSGAGVIRVTVYAQVPCFARAATEDGARSMESLGWREAGFGADKLWMQGALITPDQQVS